MVVSAGGFTCHSLKMSLRVVLYELVLGTMMAGLCIG